MNLKGPELVGILPPSTIRLLPKAEAAKLNAACPIWRVRVVGAERDGSPMDTTRRVRAPSLGVAIGITQLRATVCHGCRIDAIQGRLESA